ncbi:receptor-transporting protein 3-like [Sceloporus undulatus]|uniref:receptor-transporting protein 3-like n=1 Tax=Sceloporus undulatus TaxID=8520 RepID=UPI001C4BA953|nr:receptor-transporting protein 3-like [Sceloporus undulatus]
MPNWTVEFTKKMAAQKPWDKWILTEELESRQLQFGWHTYVQKHLFASFKCSSCSRSWKSSQVVIVFYMQLTRNILGQVRMKIYRQKCRVCGNIKYEEPSFRDDTVQFVLHNLVQKILEKCYGEVSRTAPMREPLAEDFLEGPHERKNCEACKDGWCMEKTPLILESRVMPASVVQPSEQVGSSWSSSEMACLLVAVIILVIIAFLPDSIKKEIQ